MKRILAILCVIACLCGLCVPAMAAGTITVSVKSSWSQVNLYVWEADPMASWPGTPMTKNGDWWTLEIPAGAYTNVIANDGTNQTADLKMDGSADCWIDAAAGVVYTDAACTKPFGGAAPSNPSNPGGGVNLGGLNSLALVGTGIPGVGEWNPGDAAGDMVKVSDGVYTKVIAVTAGTAMSFKIAGNDAWDDAYNFGAGEAGTAASVGTKVSLINGGGSQDIAFTATADGNLKFTVDLNAMTVLIESTNEEAGNTPVTPPPAVDGETYTVYAKVPADWKNPSIWCWNESASNPPTQGAWPGSFTMTKGDDGWYAVEIPVGFNNLLINANGGGVQTPDITGAGGQDVWINAYTDPNSPVYSFEMIPDDQISDPTTAPHVETTIRPTEGLKPSGNSHNNENTQPSSSEKPSKSEVIEEIKENDITVLLIVIGSVVVLGAVVVIFVVMKKKQSKA